MSGDPNDKKAAPPDPVEDLKKGFGLLFRAAKTAVDQLPTDKLEKVVTTGVKEVGRAIENVTDQIDRQIFHGKGTIPHPEEASAASPPAPAPAAAPPPAAAGPEPAPAPVASEAPANPDPETKVDEKKDDAPNDEVPKGPRVV